MVNNSTSINKTNNHLLNSDGQQIHQYQQNEQSPKKWLFVLLILVELLTITVKEAIVRFVDTGGIVDHHC
jgi:hypothetical protein